MSDPRRPFDELRAGWLQAADRLRVQGAALAAQAERLRRDATADPRLRDLAGDLDALAAKAEREVQRAGAVAERLGHASSAAARTWIETFRRGGEPPVR